MSVDRSNQIIAILGDPLDRRGLVIGTSESSSTIENDSSASTLASPYEP